MAVTGVASAVAGGIASSKAAKAQRKAAMLAAARQQETTNKNVDLQKDIYGKNTDLAQNTYDQQLADNATAYRDATGQVQRGYDQATGQVQQGYGQAIDTLSPFASSNALMRLHDMQGLARPGEENARAYNFQTDDPSYAWRLQQGQAALDRSAASRGLLLSGAQVKGAQEYGQGMASQEYGAAFNRLSGMANNAQQAAGQVAGYQQGMGTALANLSTGRGTAMGNLAIGQGTTLNNLGQTNLSNQSTLNTNYGNTLADLYQTGTDRVNGYNQNAAQARASGYLGVGAAVQSGIQGLGSAIGGAMGPTATTGGLYGYGQTSGINWTGPRPPGY
jgi:hypothetical protein